MKERKKEKRERDKRKKVGKQSILHSIKWLLIWIGVSICFNIFVFFVFGQKSAIDFFAGYLTEFSLSIDNVFVFLMLFMSFNVGEYAQHRVLKYGILGAIVLRFFFVFFGVAIVNAFEWVLYVFGAILIVSAAKMVFGKDHEKDPHDKLVMRILRKITPMSDDYDGDKFLTRIDGKRYITPLFGVLVLIETSDIIFAIDSVPAVLSITTDLLIVYTSNICAILGLRQLFFVVEHMQSKFRYVKYGVAVILAFTGVKMLLGILDVHISTHVSIFVIIGVLLASIVVSAAIDSYRKKRGYEEKPEDAYGGDFGVEHMEDRVKTFLENPYDEVKGEYIREEETEKDRK